MRTVLNLWAWASSLACLICGTPAVALVWLLTSPFDRGRYLTGRVFRLVGVAAVALNPLWKFRTRGKISDPRRPYVAVANHESYADIFLISGFPWEMKWLSKEVIFRIPLMGWMMHMAGDISLKRGNRKSAIHAMEECRKRLDQRVSVMIFPEGTRSRTDEMLPFKDGAFRLAIEAGVPVLPIAVAGTRNAMAKGTFTFQRARAIAVALEPIPTDSMGLEDVDRLKEIARARIEEERARLKRELGLEVSDPGRTGTAGSGTTSAQAGARATDGEADGTSSETAA